MLLQLTALLRNLADVIGMRRYFLSLGLLSELCRTMSLSTRDSDLMLNISRIFRLLLGSHTYNVRAFCFGPAYIFCLLSVCLTVPCQISKTQRDRCEISLPLQEVRVTEQACDVRFYTQVVLEKRPLNNVVAVAVVVVMSQVD